MNYPWANHVTGLVRPYSLKLKAIMPLIAGSLMATPLISGSSQEPAIAPQASPAVDESTTIIAGSVRPEFTSRMIVGSTDQSLRMEKIILSLKLAPDAKAKLDELILQQQDLTSPNYHRWLTPLEFQERFAPTSKSVDLVSDWLVSNGFQIDDQPAGGMTIICSASVAAIERTFGVKMVDVVVDGTVRHGNATELRIPSKFTSLVHGVVSLHNVPRRNYSIGASPLWAYPGHPASVYTSPVDWATIYNAAASYAVNGNGTSATIAVLGKALPPSSNWTTFRSTLGLPTNDPVVIVNGNTPGDGYATGDGGESDLDLEWAGGTAPGATIKFVTTKSTGATDGIDLSAQYAVSTNLADIISVSYGSCESTMGTTENNFYSNLWAQAAAQGISVCVSSGDAGAAGCAAGSGTSGSGFGGVNGLASTPYNVAVGATQLSNSSAYWNSDGTPKGYIPETPWNESGSVPGGSHLWATGSGSSSVYGIPSWQIGPGVPCSTQRLLPDVCFDGSDMFFGNYGMMIFSQNQLQITGGTSVAAPSFAGMMALIVQKRGRQGNPNSRLYGLGIMQYAFGGSAVFHDITNGNNDVPGLSGSTAGPAWDGVTGLGSPNVLAMVNNWSSTMNTLSIQITSPTPNQIVYNDSSFSCNASPNDSNPSAQLTYRWSITRGGQTYDCESGQATSLTPAIDPSNYTKGATLPATVRVVATDSSGATASTSTTVLVHY